MNTITSLLETLEKLAYKFLLSIIFIPKTIVQISVNPGWVQGYVRGELKQEKSPFDEYLSPVILLLVVALIPAVIFNNFLPQLGTNITAGPSEGEPATTRLLKFEAGTTVRSSSPDTYNQYTWWVERVQYDPDGTANFNVIYRETYNEYTGKADIWELNSPERIVSGTELTDLRYPNTRFNKSTSIFYYQFPENHELGQDNEYNVYFDFYNFDPDEINKIKGDGVLNPDDDQKSILDPEQNIEHILEPYSSAINVIVPASDNPDQTVGLPSDQSRKQSDGQRDNQPQKIELNKLIQNEGTIFLALGLLLPPMLFALATKIFKKEEISENSLRESFYAQCYFFAPLALAIWATVYADYFRTPDVFFYQGDARDLQAILIPLLLASLWFIGAEIQAIAVERQTSKLISFLIVVICIAILGVAVRILYLFRQPYSPVPDDMRIFVIFSYPVSTILLVAGFLLIWFRNRRSENRKLTRREAIPIMSIVLVTLGAMKFISWAVSPIPVPGSVADMPSPPLIIEFTATPIFKAPSTEPPTKPPTEAVEATSTPAIPESQPFYTEEFDGNLDNWHPLISDENQVSITLENGAIIFQIFPSEDKIPYAYLTNAAFTYTDVQVQAVVTNNGNNTNGTSLFCRSSDKGWYEFTFSNGGTYSIVAYDDASNTKELAGGGSPAIKLGKVTNIFTARCIGNELSLLMNGTLVKTVTETDFNLTEGTIGIGEVSPQLLPVNVQFESLTVSQP